MYRDKRILAVVPARGGSKGIPLKNLQTVQGVPLVGLAANCARAVPLIDRTVVSTDHERIAEVAKQYGIDAPFRRPPDLSGDRIGDVDVLIHALQATEADDGTRYDIVVMLQPTSPLRRPEHVKATISRCVDESFDAVWTVSKTDSKAHPLKQLTVRGGELQFYDSAGTAIIARQQLEPVYHRNGVAYALTRECLLQQRSLTGERTGAIILDGHNISIDTTWDIALVEFILAGAKAPKDG